MANGVFNIAKGRVVEEVADAPSNLGVLLLKASESDDVLENYDDLAAILAAGGNTQADFDGYSRKTGVTGTVTVDDTADVANVDIPDQTWSGAGGNTDNTLVKLIVFFENSANDSDRIPLTHHDFSVTTDGSDLTAQFDSQGFFQAS